MNRYLAAAAAAAATALFMFAAQIRAAQAGTIDPPRYDSDVFCWLRANTPDGFSDNAQSQCLGQQHIAYDAIRREWNELPDEIQTGCDQFTRERDPLDYEALRSCIQTQKRRIPPAPAVEGLPQ
jgi:hypothetical protein